METEELNISANEEVVLKRLKEVERTAEDIIKVGSGNWLAENGVYFAGSFTLLLTD